VAAERSLADHNEKWAIIQAIVFPFHSLRSKVLGKGYREKSHRCLKYAVEALLIDEGILDPKILEHFSFAMDLREGADYGCIYNVDSARIDHSIVYAGEYKGAPGRHLTGLQSTIGRYFGTNPEKSDTIVFG
jgi:uncharacterized protein (UPF0332 family)